MNQYIQISHKFQTAKPVCLEGIQELRPAVQRVLVAEGRRQDAAEAAIQIASKTKNEDEKKTARFRNTKRSVTMF